MARERKRDRHKRLAPSADPAKNLAAAKFFYGHLTEEQTKGFNAREEPQRFFMSACINFASGAVEALSVKIGVSDAGAGKRWRSQQSSAGRALFDRLRDLRVEDFHYGVLDAKSRHKWVNAAGIRAAVIRGVTIIEPPGTPPVEETNSELRLMGHRDPLSSHPLMEQPAARVTVHGFCEPLGDGLKIRSSGFRLMRLRKDCGESTAEELLRLSLAACAVAVDGVMLKVAHQNVQDSKGRVWYRKKCLRGFEEPASDLILVHTNSIIEFRQVDLVSPIIRTEILHIAHGSFFAFGRLAHRARAALRWRLIPA